MTFREAKRPLAGDTRGIYGYEPEIIFGTYTKSEYQYPHRGNEGKPAISVNLNGGRSGTRTYIGQEGLEAILDLIDDLGKAYLWLRENQGE